LSLSVKDFDVFHEAVHGEGKKAFDWQNRLLRQVVSDREWPRVLDLPTGIGKTTCIDIALFALALDAQNDVAKRWCPRRIAMVVDRRVVVDQAAERGRKLLLALVDPDAKPVVREVARRLRKLSRQADDPIRVFTLRGGMPKDDGWARSPDQPLIIASTVDQFGSRLLMQGFGVSPQMRPIHAGLLGNDVLLLLDEVHLSQPFAQTLDALAHLRERFTASSGLTPRFHHAFLSATVGLPNADPFRLTDEDKAPESKLAPRLHASKPASSLEVDDRRALEEVCGNEARSLIDRHDVIAVVMNRIASVSALVSRLREVCDESIQIVPITGRMRPLDRDDVLKSLRPRIMTGRSRAIVPRKLIVVATQSIEAGADFDFDAIVSEAASLDALRQRFGRLDRLGLYGKAEGVIVWDKGVKENDPVYGGAIPATMRWLKTQISGKARRVDFGILALALPPEEQLIPMLASRKSAPVLLPAYFDLWMQTSPPPACSPAVSLWLHGEDSAPAEVQVVWRADLAEHDLARAASAPPGDPAKEWPATIVGAVPPSSLEAISLPFITARRWLCGNLAGDVADVEGVCGEDQKSRQKSLVLRWTGSDSEVVSADAIQPGDTIVIPTTRGGIKDRCFEPGSTSLVFDLAERAALFSKGQPFLRLNPRVLHQLQLKLPLGDLSETCAALAELAQLEQSSDWRWRRLWLDRLASARTSIHVDVPQPWDVLRGKRVTAGTLRELITAGDTAEDGIELTTDEDDSPHTGQPISLANHSANVECFARDYARNVLPETVIDDLALAGWLHDIGKADRRYQIMLHKGSEISYLKDETPRAKSGLLPGDKVAHQLAQRRSRYPRGARHEVQSLAMLEKHLDDVRSKASDVDLVLHLVASHHGYCRPFAPPVVDQEPIDVTLPIHESKKFGSIQFAATSSNHQLHRLDAPLAERFWRLTQKYGWLELCWLEATLRLADHGASEEEQLAGRTS
jgi:CRISPR-associated endonuclease/helicase Cas3